MTPETLAALTDDELHALADGQGTTDALADLQRRLPLNPDAQRRLAQWQLQRECLHQLHTSVLQEPLPPTLAQASRRADTARQANDH